MQQVIQILSNTAGTISISSGTIVLEIVAQLMRFKIYLLTETL